MTLPRAELLAASLNASTGHVVRTALGDRHTKTWKLTDSQVVLYWINCFRSKLKMFVRNLVIHIQRLSMLDDWYHVESSNNLADLGTRKGMKVDDVGPGSKWVNGLDWMKFDPSEFPIKTISEINLSNEIQFAAQKEQIVRETIDNSATCLSHFPVVPSIVKDRYSFSRYVIDPNRFRFRKVVRVLAWVLTFIKNCCRKTGKQLTSISDGPVDMEPTQFMHPEGRYVVTHSENTKALLKCRNGLVAEMYTDSLNDALRYYFVKGTNEVKHFLPVSAYKKFSDEKNGILYYTGRILPTQRAGGDLTMCDVSFDLVKSTFCVPIVERHSPIAYSVVSEVHWNHPDVWHQSSE